MIDWTTVIVAGIAAIVGAIPPTVVAFLSLRKGDKNAGAIQEVHLSVNSRMDKLLKVSKAAAKAEGEKIGKAKGKG